MSGPSPRTSYLIGRVDRIVRRAVEQALQGFGVTVSQYTLLSVLATSPGLSNAQLARRSLISAQGMNQVVNALDGRGLVRRVAHPDNNRIRLVELTDEGAELLARCDDAVDRAEADLLAGLARDRRLAFDETLIALAGLRPDQEEATVHEGTVDGRRPDVK